MSHQLSVCSEQAQITEVYSFQRLGPSQLSSKGLKHPAVKNNIAMDLLASNVEIKYLIIYTEYFLFNLLNRHSTFLSKFNSLFFNKET